MHLDTSKCRGKKSLTVKCFVLLVAAYFYYAEMYSRILVNPFYSILPLGYEQTNAGAKNNDMAKGRFSLGIKCFDIADIFYFIGKFFSSCQ